MADVSTCEFCFYWDKLFLTKKQKERYANISGEALINTLGKCRINPPGISDEGSFDAWPLCSNSAWCGSWKKK